LADHRVRKQRLRCTIAMTNIIRKAQTIYSSAIIGQRSSSDRTRQHSRD